MRCTFFEGRKKTKNEWVRTEGYKRGIVEKKTKNLFSQSWSWDYFHYQKARGQDPVYRPMISKLKYTRIWNFFVVNLLIRKSPFENSELTDDFDSILAFISLLKNRHGVSPGDPTIPSSTHFLLLKSETKTEFLQSRFSFCSIILIFIL